MKMFRTLPSLTCLVAVAFFTLVPSVDARGPRAPRAPQHHTPRMSAPRAYRAPHVANARPRTNNTARPRTNTNVNRGAGQYRRPYVARGPIRRPRSTTTVRRYAHSNRNVQAVVKQLRSVHHNLARLDHDYKGNRVKAMRSIATAVRHLTHSSSGMGTSLRVNNGSTRTQTGNANNGTRRPRMPQAQSDAQMRMASQRLSQVASHLQTSGSTSNHARALGSVHQAQHHLAVALTVR